jgi:hypothetical protein
MEPGYVRTYPQSCYNINISQGENVTDKNFGNILGHVG